MFRATSTRKKIVWIGKLLSPSPVRKKKKIISGLFLKSPETFRAYFGCHNYRLYLRNSEVLSHQTSQSSWFFLGGIYMRPGRTQIGMNSDRYEMFAIVYTKPGRNAWCLILGQNDMFCQMNISLTQKYTGLKFLDPV